MLLAKLGEYLLLELPIWICKVLFACLPCMASFWGSLVWLAVISVIPVEGLSLFFNLALVIPFVFMVSGFNTLADAFFLYCDVYKNDDHELHI
jgi:hypothetical protein